MQGTYSLLPSSYAAIERTLSPQRLSRFLPAAYGDKQFAFRLYLWNIKLCEAFYLPCHICEVTIRNGIHQALTTHYSSENWYLIPRMRNNLPNRLDAELSQVITRIQNEHGHTASIHHIISGLSLGFWNDLLCRRYQNSLWQGGITSAFPHAGMSETYQTAYMRLQRFRNWRNRIFHHNPIFDKGPTAELQNIYTLLGWCCKETQWLVRHESTVSKIINSRPKS